MDQARHGYREVGDEALLLAGVAPTWIARNRAAGAQAAVAAGATVLVLDDGFQNPSLVQDLKFLVVDGLYGFGNGQRGCRPDRCVSPRPRAWPAPTRSW